MKLLDRYILSSFIRNYVISLLVLIGLYVVLDMVFNADDFTVTRDETGVRAATAFDVAANMGSFYFYQAFLIFQQLSGVIPVAAAAFTLLRFSRFNELTALMAAGVPLQRVAVPVILCAVFSTGLVFVNNEFVIPALIPQLTRERSDVGEQRSKGVDIKAMQDADRHALLFAGSYHAPVPGRGAYMDYLDVLTVDDDFNPVAHTRADRADYDPIAKVWNLTNGFSVTGLSPREKRSRPEPVAQYVSNVSPEEIALFKSGDYVNLLSTPRIDQLLARTVTYGGNNLLRVKHQRLAQYLLNITLVVLAASCTLLREPSQLKFAVVKTLLFVGLCMATVFLCQNFSDRAPHVAWLNAAQWPALMAFLPVLVFGPIAVALLHRVKT